MKRTQIQLPDALHAAAHDVAEQKEISLAELVRRGLEYMVAIAPKAAEGETGGWELPEAVDLESKDPFASPAWRANLHRDGLRFAEEPGDYETSSDGGG